MKHKRSSGKSGFSSQNRNSGEKSQNRNSSENRGNQSPSRGRGSRNRQKPDRLNLYGMHTVRAAIANEGREKFRLNATENALARLNIEPELLENMKVDIVEPGHLARMVGSEAVHQGVVLEAAPLPTVDIDNMTQKPLVLVLDQITDPHNVGAILRTAVAMDAGAVISTARNSAQETGVLAKSASGAVDLIDHIQIGNLANAITQLSDQGYYCIGLDSEGPAPLEETFAQAPNDGKFIALVLGAEGQGLRKKTRETCNALARLDMPGAIKSLNVSNAAAISLYAARLFLDK